LRETLIKFKAEGATPRKLSALSLVLYTLFNC
jgi:hypothetical protein